MWQIWLVYSFDLELWTLMESRGFAVTAERWLLPYKDNLWPKEHIKTLSHYHKEGFFFLSLSLYFVSFSKYIICFWQSTSVWVRKVSIMLHQCVCVCVCVCVCASTCMCTLRLGENRKFNKSLCVLLNLPRSQFTNPPAVRTASSPRWTALTSNYLQFSQMEKKKKRIKSCFICWKHFFFTHFHSIFTSILLFIAVLNCCLPPFCLARFSPDARWITFLYLFHSAAVVWLHLPN